MANLRFRAGSRRPALDLRNHRRSKRKPRYPIYHDFRSRGKEAEDSIARRVSDTFGPPFDSRPVCRPASYGRRGSRAKNLATRNGPSSALPIARPHRCESRSGLRGVRPGVTVTERATQVQHGCLGEPRYRQALDRQMLDNLPVFDQDYVGAMSQFLDAGLHRNRRRHAGCERHGAEETSAFSRRRAIQQGGQSIRIPIRRSFFAPRAEGRIEVITKPGSTAYHGHVRFSFLETII